MTDTERNLYGEALAALEGIRIPLTPLEPGEVAAVAQARASIASAKASLALCDAIYHLRDHIEELPARLERRLGESK